MLSIIRRRKIFFVISGVLFLASIIGFFVFGFKLSIDFTGGTLMEVSFEKNRPNVNNIKQKLDELNMGIVSIQLSGEKEIIIKAKDLNNEQRNEVLKTVKKNFKDAGKISELRFESIGPSIGKELKDKAFVAIALAAICMVLYIAYVFRKMSSTISSWKMGICAIVALVHDIVITCGIFIFLGAFWGVEIDILFVTALLVVLGYSVNDTIIVFDRIRYNVLKNSSVDFEINVENSINQTLVRSLGTTITTLLVLLALLLFGGASIEWFVVALMVGIGIGAYSSIFIAAPLLVEWEGWEKRRK